MRGWRAFWHKILKHVIMSKQNSPKGMRNQECLPIRSLTIKLVKSEKLLSFTPVIFAINGLQISARRPIPFFEPIQIRFFQEDEVP